MTEAIVTGAGSHDCNVSLAGYAGEVTQRARRSLEGYDTCGWICWSMYGVGGVSKKGGLELGEGGGCLRC